MNVKAPELPFFIDAEYVECWVVVLPDDLVEHPNDEAWIDWSDGEPHIAMRVYDERVLLHEVMHIIFKRAERVIGQWVAARDEVGEKQFAAEEAIVRALTAGLFGMGWRWRVLDRNAHAVERERRRAFDARESVLASVETDARELHDVGGHPGAFDGCLEGACGVFVRAVKAARV